MQKNIYSTPDWRVWTGRWIISKWIDIHNNLYIYIYFSLLDSCVVHSFYFCSVFAPRIIYDDAKWCVVDDTLACFVLLIMLAARVADDSRVADDFGGITGLQGIGGGAPRPLLLFTGFTFVWRLLFYGMQWKEHKFRINKVLKNFVDSFWVWPFSTHIWCTGDLSIYACSYCCNATSGTWNGCNWRCSGWRLWFYCCCGCLSYITFEWISWEHLRGENY